MCGLSPFADAMIGSLGVEQKKRTTIGVELAAKVRLYTIEYAILFLFIGKTAATSAFP